MASFDFVDAAAKAYELVWRRRSYIARVAVPVVFVKLACLLAVHVFGFEKKFLLSGLVMIPGFVLEAIFAIGLIRYVLYREPIFISGRVVPMPDDDTPPVRYFGPLSPSKCLQAGFAMYLIIKIVQVAFSAWVQDYNIILESQNINPEPVTPTMIHSILMLSLLWLIIWTFRLGWLYIPVAMGYSFVDFLKRIKGLGSSFYIFAAWFICSLPILILYAGVINIVELVFADGTGINVVLSSFVLVAAEVIMVALQVVAMTYGFTEILSSDNKKTEK